MSQAKMRKITNRLKHQVSESGRIKATELTWRNGREAGDTSAVSAVKTGVEMKHKAALLPGKGKAILKKKVEIPSQNSRRKSILKRVLVLYKPIFSFTEAVATRHCTKDTAKENQEPKNPREGKLKEALS